MNIAFAEQTRSLKRTAARVTAEHTTAPMSLITTGSSDALTVVETTSPHDSQDKHWEKCRTLLHHRLDVDSTLQAKGCQDCPYHLRK